MTGNGSNVNLLKKMADFGLCKKGMGFMIALVLSVVRQSFLPQRY